MRSAGAIGAAASGRGVGGVERSLGERPSFVVDRSFSEAGDRAGLDLPRSRSRRRERG